MPMFVLNTPARYPNDDAGNKEKEFVGFAGRFCLSGDNEHLQDIQKIVNQSTIKLNGNKAPNAAIAAGEDKNTERGKFPSESNPSAVSRGRKRKRSLKKIQSFLNDTVQPVDVIDYASSPPNIGSHSADSNSNYAGKDGSSTSMSNITTVHMEQDNLFDPSCVGDPILFIPNVGEPIEIVEVQTVLHEDMDVSTENAAEAATSVIADPYDFTGSQVSTPNPAFEEASIGDRLLKQLNIISEKKPSLYDNFSAAATAATASANFRLNANDNTWPMNRYQPIRSTVSMQDDLAMPVLRSMLRAPSQQASQAHVPGSCSSGSSTTVATPDLQTHAVADVDNRPISNPPGIQSRGNANDMNVNTTEPQMLPNDGNSMLHQNGYQQPQNSANQEEEILILDLYQPICGSISDYEGDDDGENKSPLLPSPIPSTPTFRFLPEDDQEKEGEEFKGAARTIKIAEGKNKIRDLSISEYISPQEAVERCKNLGLSDAQKEINKFSAIITVGKGFQERKTQKDTNAFSLRQEVNVVNINNSIRVPVQDDQVPTSS